LYHHLTLLQVPGVFVFRFVLLLALWLVLCRTTSAAGAATRRVRALVAGAVAIALAGAAISFAAPLDRPLAAGLLRFYWFRMADVAVPLGVALEVSSLIAVKLRRQPVAGRCWLAAATVIACLHVGIHAAGRLVAVPPRAYRLSPRVSDYVDWRLVCDWVAHSGEVPPQARFLTPRMAQTFKWYARRSEVANWKEIPQDAAAIVEWWRRIEEIHATGIHRPDRRWHDSLAQLDADPPRCAERLRQLGEEYGADYVLTVSRPRLPLEVVYPNRSHPNRSYVVYRLR